MLITIDTDKDNGERIRSLIGFLAHLYNLETDESVPEGTSNPKAPAAPSAATSAAIATSVASAAATAPATATTAPAPASNVVNFPVPPPPPATTAAETGSTSSVAPAAAAAPNVAFVPAAPGAVAPTNSQTAIVAEYDAAGMPWDARIHQKAKGKKKDLTWKLIKGIDEATVIAVTAELAARKIATPASPSLPPAPAPSVPPPPTAGTVAILGQNGNVVATGAVPPPPATVAPQVLLSEPNNAGQQNSVPMPPVPSTAPVETVSAPAAPAAGVVPVPPVAAAGAVGGITYRTIVDKATEGTRQQKLTAQQFIAMVLAAGCPNLQQLNQMPSVWADVDARLDMALAGLT